MIFATKIRMQAGCGNSRNLTEIASIYLLGKDVAGFYPKESIHNYLKQYPGTIKVGLEPFPTIIPAVSCYGEKYVKSEPNTSGLDNLLCLPRA